MSASVLLVLLCDAGKDGGETVLKTSLVVSVALEIYRDERCRSIVKCDNGPNSETPRLFSKATEMISGVSKSVSLFNNVEFMSLCF
ncbi:hypothetical protein E2C01_049070 [Portunus trituberculatus]|uniref:Uncharacterized protein n=1 Tax=Portunus trituberculatus TaxID=210409 RepID=A0A5B7GBW5_PORTR|nr:hypothetical protein [Portunus trituberculatus]